MVEKEISCSASARRLILLLESHGVVLDFIPSTSQAIRSRHEIKFAIGHISLICQVIGIIHSHANVVVEILLLLEDHCPRPYSARGCSGWHTLDNKTMVSNLLDNSVQAPEGFTMIKGALSNKEWYHIYTRSRYIDIMTMLQLLG